MTPNGTLRRLFPPLAIALLVILVAGKAYTPKAGASVAPEVPAEIGVAERPDAAVLDTAVFAGGCFWGVEGVYEHLKGVRSAVAGYAGGSKVSPTYEEVSSGTTGHAESVQVVYDPAIITYDQLLQVLFAVAHDPTELNRQGPDEGTQYRSVVFFRNAAQQHAVESYVAQLTQTKAYPRPIVTQIVPFKVFYPAEAYHQHYMALHPTSSYIIYNDAPKVERLRQRFPTWYQDR